jgi:hypothetical protein
MNEPQEKDRWDGMKQIWIIWGRVNTFYHTISIFWYILGNEHPLTTCAAVPRVP